MMIKISFIIPSSPSVQFGGNYTIEFNIGGSTIFAPRISTIIGECPSGTGFSPDSLAPQCALCTDGTFKIFEGVSSCIECDNTIGIRCNGADIVRIDHNYWFSYSLNNSKITTSICPPFYCCSSFTGCNYVNDKSSLCAMNRDPDSLLCSQCLDGYSELIGTNQCGICDKNQLHLLIIPYILTLLFAFYLLYIQSYTVLDKSEALEIIQNERMMVLKYNIRSLSTMLFVVILYYNQLFSYLLLYFDVTNESLSAYLSIFNLSVSNNNNQNGICFYKNMLPHHKILLNLVVSVMLLFNVSLLLPIFSYLLRLGKCFCWDKRFTHPNVLNAFLNSILICLGTIVSVLFQLISCVTIDDVRYHFYFAYEKCFGGYWNAALICAICIILAFVLLLLRLIVMPYDYRNNPKTNKIFRLIKPYKPSVYYYEFIYVSRRILLGAMVFALPKNDFMIYSMLVILLIYLFTHFKLAPFLYKRANLLETICIGLLIIMYNSLLIFGDTIYIQYMIPLFLIIPWIIPIYWAMVTLKNIFCVDDSPKNVNKIANSMMRTDTKKRNKLELVPPHSEQTNEMETYNQIPVKSPSNLNETSSKDISTEAETEGKDAKTNTANNTKSISRATSTVTINITPETQNDDNNPESSKKASKITKK